MFIFGTIIAIALAIAFAMLFGQYGGLLLVALIFGFVFSIYIRMNKLHEDVQAIKRKLGIDDERDFHMDNEEIEKELEKHIDSTEHKRGE